jgi:surface carbohydrate biosynthesis protein
MTDCIIFDERGSDILTKTCLHDIPHNIFSLSDIEPSLYTMQNIMRTATINTLYKKYIESRLKKAHPKVIITWVDNNPLWWWLSRVYKNATLISVQNGVRLESNLTDGGTQTHQHLMCWGKRDVDNYAMFGHVVERFHPIGSVKMDYYKNTRHSLDVKQEYDISLISEHQFFMNNKYPLLQKGVASLHERLRSYLEEYPSIKCCVAMRTDIDEEFKYFKNIFGGRIDIIKNISGFNTYKLMSKSKLSLTMDSSAGIEGLGLGKKVIFVNMSSVGERNFPEFGGITKPTQEQFNNIISSTLDVDEVEYMNKIRKSVDYYITRNPVPAHEYLNGFIKSLIS